MQYYCHDCAITSGLLTPASPVAFTETQYQLEKYLKHTAPTTAYDFNSVFTGPGSEMYQKFIVTTVASGHLQVDDRGRKNVVWVGSDQTGISYTGGTFVGPTDAVKVVLHDDDKKIHGFPIHYSDLKAATCAVCGRPVPY